MPTITPFADIGLPFENIGHCLLAAFIDDEPVLVSAEGRVLLPRQSKIIAVSDGIASSVLSHDSKSVLTGGEDGRLCRVHASGETQELACFGKKWLSALASGPDGSYAVASGRMIFAFDGKRQHQWQEARSVEGLAFAPKGLRLGVARYNGVSLHWLGTQAEPQQLEWKGAHQALTFSPDGKFLVTTMQENALHGWRLADKQANNQAKSQHLRMSGYPAKIKSWSWSVKGRHLATSGAMAAIVWPFITKDGPMGKPPLELGIRPNTLASCVACHPHEEMVAIGYEDGMIVFARFSDQREIVLRHPSQAENGRAMITAMGWDAAGLRLAFGSTGGEGGLIDVSS